MLKREPLRPRFRAVAETFPDFLAFYMAACLYSRLCFFRVLFFFSMVLNLSLMMCPVHGYQVRRMVLAGLKVMFGFENPGFGLKRSEALGVTKGNFYNYFESKPQAIEQALQIWLESENQIMANPKPSSFSNCLEKTAIG